MRSSMPMSVCSCFFHFPRCCAVENVSFPSSSAFLKSLVLGMGSLHVGVACTILRFDLYCLIHNRVFCKVVSARTETLMI